MPDKMKLREEHLDRSLDVLFLARYSQDYLVIYGEGSLWRYAHDRSLMDKPEYDKRIRYVEKFAPDAVALTRDGRVVVIEAKVRPVRARQCGDLVIQTLRYVNFLLSPNIGGTACDRYDFIEMLFKSYWFTSEGRWIDKSMTLGRLYMEYFGLKRGLNAARIRRGVPQALFIAPAVDVKTLLDACESVHDCKRFSDWKRWAKDATGKREAEKIGQLERNWQKLRRTEFHMMILDMPALAPLLGRVSKIC
jgi:hypothetical protein